MNGMYLLLKGFQMIIFPKFHYRKPSLNDVEYFAEELKNLCSDWQTIGRDFRRVLNKYGRR